MHSVNACMVCGEAKRTIVAEYNRLIFMDSMWQSELARFDYAMCHGCGLVYATRRPERAEYEFLYEHFNEFLLRKPKTNSFNVSELTARTKREIDRDYLPWWQLEAAQNGKSGVGQFLRRELKTATHYLNSLPADLPLNGGKVLHIRAKSATLVDLIRRKRGATKADIITLFPAHKYLAEKNPGIRAECCLDYEDFKIPFDDSYDLIIENHILTHTLDINKTFEIFRSHLKRGGILFLQHELADDQMFRWQKNLFAELKPFHFQQFDRSTLDRVLLRYGFKAGSLFLRDERGDAELFGSGALEHETRPCPRINPKELHARLQMYARWRDESIVSLPKEQCQQLYAGELEQVWSRVRASGGLKKSVFGKPAALRRFYEANIADEELEIGSAVGYGRARAARWLAAIVRGGRIGRWLWAKLKNTGLGGRARAAFPGLARLKKPN